MFAMRDTISFVKAVEKYPCLYNYNIKDYSKKEATDVAWTAIAEEFNVSEQLCRERWKNIRSCYVRAQKCGRSNYYLKNHMEFVRPFTKIKQNGSKETNVDEEGESNSLDSTIENPEIIEYTEDADESFDQDDNFQLSPVPQSAQIKREPKGSLKRKFQTSTHLKQDDSDSGRFEGSVNSVCDDEDADLLFFKSLLPDIRELPGKKKRVFKRKVMTLLEDFLDDN